MHEAGQDGRLGRLRSQRARPCLPRAGHSPLIVTDEKRGQGRRGRGDTRRLPAVRRLLEVTLS